MVSRKGRDAVVQHALLPSDSPLEKTPHKTGNGELSITCCDRHCPKCQSFARFKWLLDRQAELLNTQYFHVVFTLPQQIATIAYQSKRELYGILFRATAQTLLTIAADPKHLGAEIGFFAVLHTWGQNLLHHPHLHCVVTGGGLSADGSQWISCRDGFFLPVGVLSRLFRRLFLEYLLKAFDAGKLEFFSSLESLRDRCFIPGLPGSLTRGRMGGLRQAAFRRTRAGIGLRRRYTHRVAISNNRLLDIAEDRVTFRYKDYRHDAQQKTMTLEAEEFIRRFLLHVLPEGFQRIRYYGFLANRYREQKLAHCRELWTCRRRNHRPSKVPRIIVSVMKNSSALSCGSAQSVTKVGCS